MEISSIAIIGKLWKDQFGNTYHTALAIVDGIEYRSEVTYGYDCEYVATALTMLERRDVIPYGSTFHSLREAGVNVTCNKIRVDRRKDL